MMAVRNVQGFGSNNMSRNFLDFAAVQQLFANGEQGGWWDPADLYSLYQDSAGTTPVTAVGQPVGKILDKSGRGNHRIQATAAARPTLAMDANGFYYLSYDGVQQFMQTAGAVDLSGTNKLTVFTAMRIGADAAAILLEHGANSTLNTNPGTFNVSYSAGAGSRIDYVGGPSGTGASVTGVVGNNIAPDSESIVGLYDLSAPSIQGKLNGVAGAVNAANPGGGNFASATMYFGARAGASLFMNGREYASIVRGAATPDSTVMQVSRYLGRKMGVSF